jgi:FMN reductase/FAD reductase [NAD(P)H]
MTTRVADALAAGGHAVDRLTLADVAMEFCDGRPLEEYGAGMREAAARVERAQAYVIGMPVYCYSLPGVLKNFLDVACAGMEDKPFAVVAVGGGERSYMATADLQRILSFEVRARPFPKVVYASDRHFDGADLDEEVGRRLDELGREFGAWAAATSLGE